MTIFQEINSENNVKEMILSAFDLDLDISGSWGYSQKKATIIQALDVDTIQLEHRLASLRAYIEMNMTLTSEERYASISLKELSRQQKNINGLLYDVIVYEITAMQEKIYTSFINTYKEMYGKEEFDMSTHFRQRKEATLTREVEHWFELSQTL